MKNDDSKTRESGTVAFAKMFVTVLIIILIAFCVLAGIVKKQMSEETNTSSVRIPDCYSFEVGM